MGFFQLEMQGGIFQSCWSLTLTARGGECITGTGGDPGPRGTYTALRPTSSQVSGTAGNWGKVHESISLALGF